LPSPHLLSPLFCPPQFRLLSTGTEILAEIYLLILKAGPS
jgi:hypothetical protein